MLSPSTLRPTVPTRPLLSAELPGSVVANNARVRRCYALFDKYFPACGMPDYTEGMYHGDPTIPFEQAQLNQIGYVLDEAGCSAGMRILDVGCGNGSLLDELRRRGARGVGITISPEQVKLCRSRGLDVRLLDYKLLDQSYAGRFDAVIANGPIEHFVQAKDASRGSADAIYQHMFSIFRRAIDPHSSVRRLVNTTIHFVRAPAADDLLVAPWRFRRGSDAWHWSWLARSFGGWYPTCGQLERCAKDHFRLLHTTDGTEDYCLTSEAWLRRIRQKNLTRLGLRMLLKSLPLTVCHPLQTSEMFICMLLTESWNWQFRGPRPPTRLLRQTWSCAD